MEDARLEKLIEAQAERIASSIKLEVENRRRNKPRFNWEINLGHMLIVVSMLAGVFTAYADVKLAVADVRAETVMNKASIITVKERQDTDIREIKASIRRIEDKMDAKADKQ